MTGLQFDRIGHDNMILFLCSKILNPNQSNWRPSRLCATDPIVIVLYTDCCFIQQHLAARQYLQNLHQASVNQDVYQITIYFLLFVYISMKMWHFCVSLGHLKKIQIHKTSQPNAKTSRFCHNVNEPLVNNYSTLPTITP